MTGRVRGGVGMMGMRRCGVWNKKSEEDHAFSVVCSKQQTNAILATYLP
jgi:hypothetical protein